MWEIFLHLILLVIIKCIPSQTQAILNVSTFYRFYEVLLTLSMLVSPSVLTEIYSERCKEYTFSDQTTA